MPHLLLRLAIGLTAILAASCSGDRGKASSALDISNDHIVVAGETASGYWKVDIKAGHGIYSSQSFDAPLNTAFNGETSGNNIHLNNGFAKVILLPGACRNEHVSGDYIARVETGDKVLSGCGQKQALPEIRTISASGNEPFWNFRITGDTAIYSAPEMLDGVTLPVAKKIIESVTEYSGKLDGANFTLSITKDPCQDDMSGFAFPMTVRLAIDGNRYNGCARLD